MKNLIYLAIVLLPLITFAQNQPKTTINVSANYHNRSCVGGLGLCSETDTVAESKNGNASLQKKNESEIVLSFDTKTISKNELATLKSENRFLISGEKNISLDSNLVSKLKINARFSEIKSGAYPFVIQENSIQITFTLTSK